jgi:hypothetical protein
MDKKSHKAYLTPWQQAFVYTIYIKAKAKSKEQLIFSHISIYSRLSSSSSSAAALKYNRKITSNKKKEEEFHISHNELYNFL